MQTSECEHEEDDMGVYIRAPSELISLPVMLQTVTPKIKLRRPVRDLTFIAPQRPKKIRKQMKKDNEQQEYIAPDSCISHPNRIDRCRINENGTIVAIPNRVDVICPDVRDEEQELTVIEIKGPGNERSWLEDDAVRLIRIESANQEFMVSRLEIKKYISKKVALTPPGRNPRRELYKVFAPFEKKNDILICLVPSNDILSNCI